MRAAAGRLLRRFTLRQVSTLLGVFGILLVAGVSGLMAVKDRGTLYEEARDHAGQTATFLADHAERLFEAADLVLHATATSLGTLDWDAVAANPDVSGSIKRLDDLLPYVDTVFGADRDGAVRITTLAPQLTRYSVADRSVFIEARKAKGDGLIVGEPIVGRVSHKPTFLLARRREAPDGSFDGILGAAMALGYFTDYWRTVEMRNDERVALVRGDSGGVLARFPEGEDEGEARLGRALVSAVAAGEGARAGQLEPGPHEFGSYHQVGTLPVYTVVVFRDAIITARWLTALRGLALPALLTVVALMLMMALAHRLARREDRARRQIEKARLALSRTNAELEQHVAERTAELVESNKEIQRFAYIVSHDLRAPLVNIMGFTAELQGHFGAMVAKGAAAGPVGEEVTEAFRFITSSIEKMDRLIKAILTLSRQGQRPLKPELLDMGALVRSAVDGVAHRVQQAGASVEIGRMPDITADRIAVEQVFANLLDNAVKYLRPGVPGVIRIEGAEAAATATFTVTDNGRGIDPADRERVFELFRRAGRQDAPGEGIGLAHVRSMVRRLQGTIELDGVEGPGCVFTVTLPRTVSTSEDQASPHG